MSRTSLAVAGASTSVPQLKIHRPEPATSSDATWRINGYRARLVVWPHEEFRRLESPPADAQFFSCGVWCALRLE